MPEWRTSAARRLWDRDVLERVPGVFSDVPDRVSLGLWPHCLCLDPAVFGHKPYCRILRK